MIVKKLLLFDIDGTLISSGGAGNKALNRAFFEVQGVRHMAQKIRMDGKTDRAIVREILRFLKDGENPAGPDLNQEDEIIDEILKKYLEFLPEEIERSLAYQVLPGILDILEQAFENEHFLLGLATGNLKIGAEIKLRRGNLNHFFPFGGFGCDSENRPEIVKRAYERAQECHPGKISLKDTFIIGDTHHDITAGKILGAKTIGVTTGSYSENHLANYEPNFIFKNFSDPRKFFEIFSN